MGTPHRGSVTNMNWTVCSPVHCSPFPCLPVRRGRERERDKTLSIFTFSLCAATERASGKPCSPPGKAEGVRVQSLLEEHRLVGFVVSEPVLKFCSWTTDSSITSVLQSKKMKNYSMAQGSSLEGIVVLTQQIRLLMGHFAALLRTQRELKLT